MSNIGSVTAATGRPALGVDLVDPRGQRFAATLTALLLAAALVLAPSTLTTVLVATQALVFAVGAFAGPQHTPYALVFKSVLRPRLGPPAELEDAVPPRFAQGVGFAFAVTALVAALAGLDVLVLVALGLALAAAFLNAAFGFCLGCEIYLLIQRVRPRTNP